jgi:hypothetical protein
LRNDEYQELVGSVPATPTTAVAATAAADATAVSTVFFLAVTKVLLSLYQTEPGGHAL